MGTQYGVFPRILATLATLATLACLGLLTSITSAVLMWWKRRPTGSAGLPGRTGDAALAHTPRGAAVAIGVIAVALGLLYPSFGVTALIVLAAEAVLSARRKRRASAPG